MNIRRIAEWAVPALAVVAVPLVAWAYADRVPDPMAIHWGPSGEPDGAGPLWLSTLLMTIVVALLGLGPVAALRAVPGTFTKRALVATSHGAAVFLLVVHVLGLEANAGAATWQAAERLGPGSVLGFLVLSLPFAALGWVLPGDRPDDGPTVHPTAAVDVEPGEAVVWSGTARVRGAWVPLVVVAGVVALLLGIGDVRPDATIAVVMGVVALAIGVLLSGTRVTIGPAGVRVSLGPLRWPAISVPVEEVAGVDVIDVQPMAYGGWGYRVVPGSRAVVMRAGEGLRIERLGAHPDLVVTVDDARTGAGVLRAHLTPSDV